MGLRRGALAAAGCVAMQLPYALAGEPEEAGAVGEILTSSVPANINAEYDGYSNHWWWDNVAHYLGGYAVGSVLSLAFDDENTVLKAFLVITGAWEAFEYVSGERPWHTDENGDMVWEFDHAMEDTMLDTAMGAAGAWRAARDSS